MSKRTLNQNNALHKYFELLSATLNAQGLTVDVILKADTVWTPESVKELIWRPIQKATVGKQSTTKLSTKEVTEVYDTLNAALGQKLGVHVPFPHIEEKENNGIQ